MMLAWDAFEKDPRTYGRSENGRESGIATMGVNVFTGDEKKSRAGSVRCVKFPCMNRDSDCVSAAVGAEITCGLVCTPFFLHAISRAASRLDTSHGPFDGHRSVSDQGEGSRRRGAWGEPKPRPRSSFTPSGYVRRKIPRAKYSQ